MRVPGGIGPVEMVTNDIGKVSLDKVGLGAMSTNTAADTDGEAIRASWGLRSSGSVSVW